MIHCFLFPLDEPRLKKQRLADDLPTNPSNLSVTGILQKDLHSSNSIDIDTMHPKMPAYCHWFAIELRNIYHNFLANSQPTISLTLCDASYTIQMTALERASKAIQTFCTLVDAVDQSRGLLSDTHLMSHELAFTSRFTRALDRFLFPDNLIDKGECLHQVPSRCRDGDHRKTDICDIYCATFPSGPVLLADLKNFDATVAAEESVLYAVNGSSVQNVREKKFCLQVGIPATRESMNLVVYMPINKKIWRLPVAKAVPWNKALLCTIYVAVHYLIDRPIVQYNSAFKPQPKKNLELEQLIDGNIRVYTDSNNTKVYKFFETNGSEEPNEKLLNDLSIDCSLNDFTDDGAYRILELPFNEGNHDLPSNLDSFRGALEKLSEVHKKGMVHGDIRIPNILFSEGNSTLIDFDLARGIGERYPYNYKHFLGRHPDATANAVMQICHDKFAFAEIIKACGIEISEEVLKFDCKDWIDNLKKE